MAFTYINSKESAYFLRAFTTALKNGNTQTIYFFVRTEKEGVLEGVPGGYEVSESKNGLPVLKRSTQ